MLQWVVVVYFVLYKCIAAGIVRKFRVSLFLFATHDSTTDNPTRLALERPECAPYLFIFGLSIGVIENCLVVSLLSATGTQGQPLLENTKIRVPVVRPLTGTNILRSSVTPGPIHCHNRSSKRCGHGRDSILDPEVHPFRLEVSPWRRSRYSEGEWPPFHSYLSDNIKLIQPTDHSKGGQESRKHPQFKSRSAIWSHQCLRWFDRKGPRSVLSAATGLPVLKTEGAGI
jgi:hypothetical protein